MSKERLQDFNDAVLAIIMTILMLEPEAPKKMSFTGFWELREGFFSYAVSFGLVLYEWLTITKDNYVRKVRSSTVWWTVITLFFASLFPYTKLSWSNNSFAQGLYGIVVLLVSISKLMESRSLLLADSDNKTLAKSGLIANRGIRGVPLKYLDSFCQLRFLHLP